MQNLWGNGLHFRFGEFGKMNVAEITEQRGALRMLLNCAGYLSYSVPRQTQHCHVVDVSQTGAKLRVESVNHVPDAFRLHIDSADFSSECIVVWRGANEVGVIFQAAPRF